MILPPATLGMLGGGQLGRFFVAAAHEMGYKIWVLDPDPNSPAGLIADRHLQAAYDDYAALDVLAEGCAAVTTEFENVPADTLDYLAKFIPVRPGAAAVAVCQNRIAEKSFLRANNLPHGPFAVITADADIETAVRTAIVQGARVVLACGGTGIGPRDRTSDVVRALIDVELPGIAEELRRRGLEVGERHLSARRQQRQRVRRHRAVHGQRRQRASASRRTQPQVEFGEYRSKIPCRAVQGVRDDGQERARGGGARKARRTTPRVRPHARRNPQSAADAWPLNRTPALFNQ